MRKHKDPNRAVQHIHPLHVGKRRVWRVMTPYGITTVPMLSRKLVMPYNTLLAKLKAGGYRGMHIYPF